jgi:glutathione synthase/RimK-type ligase-like ATP-grasp enzyme
MAWVLQQNGDALADWHWRRGYSGHSIVRKPYRGLGSGVPLLLLVSARGGNIPTQLWITDRQFAVSAIYAEFYDPEAALPPHALIVNAVGDADLCDAALAGAEEIASRSKAPVINPPARVRHTGRVENARRLCCIEGVVAPIIRALSPAAILAEAGLQFPLLLRRPGFHTGRHFVYVKDRDGLAPAIDSLGGKELLVIPYLDARGADGMARKYRVMFIDGAAYALHLAISADWKVHYFSAAMQDEGAYRDEERRFLEDMPAVLGPRAMRALAQIQRALGLDYGGVDFALAPDGSVLLFEANATMVIAPPSADPMWDYRRRAIGEVLKAATRMLLRRTNAGGVPQTLEHDS